MSLFSHLKETFQSLCVMFSLAILLKGANNFGICLSHVYHVAIWKASDYSQASEYSVSLWLDGDSNAKQ